MMTSYNKAYITSEEAIKALWGEEYNETTRKRLRQFVKAGHIKADRSGTKGKFYIPASEINRLLKG